MNRWDEIQGLARDIASNVHADPAARDAMADDLIKLCGLMIGAVGKGVAIDGESSMMEPDDDVDERQAACRFRVGDQVQEAAAKAVAESVNSGCDLDRWTRPSPGDPCRCGHVPSVHEGGRCTGEQYNREACKGGPCTGFVRREPEWGWRPTDRRPDALKYAAVKAAEADPFATFQLCPPDRRPAALRPVARVVDLPPVPEPGAPQPPFRATLQDFHDASATFRLCPPHTWVTALDEMGQPARDAAGNTWQLCGVCGLKQPPRPCCYPTTCATCRSGSPIGDCCRPLGDVCSLHH